jgi:hypothetical protein
MQVLARKFATQKVDNDENQPSNIEAYLSCRLMPLDS